MSSKIVTAEEAVKVIKTGDTVATEGLAAKRFS